MITAPISQSIRFRPVNNYPANFDNTFDAENYYIQYVQPENLKVQLSRVNDSLAFPELYIVECNGTETEVTTPETHIVGVNIYYTFTLPLALFENKKLRLKVVEVWNSAPNAITHYSEYFTVQDQPTFLKLNWFNTENGFTLDYSTGLVNQLMIEGKMHKLSFGGEASVYSNQGTDVKLKEIVSRVFSFETDVPDYVAEQITLAMAHDRFYINEIEFVTSKKPTQNQIGLSNMYQFAAEIKQKAVIGINTHDAG